MPEDTTPEQLRLARLVAHVGQHDDRTAFEALYRELAAVVCAVAARICGDPGLAQDVTQDVLLEIWQTAHRYTPERGSVRAWAHTIARHRAIDAVCSHQARHDREQDASWGIHEISTPDPVGELVDDHLDHQTVRSTLPSLSALQYQAIVLAYYHGLTLREIAERLDVPLPTVKSRVRGALRRLRDHLIDLNHTALSPTEPVADELGLTDP